MPPTAPLMTQTPNGPIANRTNGSLLLTIIAAWLVRALCGYLPPDLGKPVQDALTLEVMGYLSVGGAAIAMWFRSRVGNTAFPAFKLPLIPPLAMWLLLLGVLLTSCVTAWPQVCRQTTKGIQCDGKAAEFVVDPHPAGLKRPAAHVEIWIDGKALPIFIDTLMLRLPAAPCVQAPAAPSTTDSDAPPLATLPADPMHAALSARRRNCSTSAWLRLRAFRYVDAGLAVNDVGPGGVRRRIWPPRLRATFERLFLLSNGV